MLQRPCVIKIICFHHILHRCSHPRCSMYQLASSSDNVTKRRWSLKQAIMSQPEWKITIGWLPWLMVFVASKWIWFLGQTEMIKKVSLYTSATCIYMECWGLQVVGLGIETVIFHLFSLFQPFPAGKDCYQRNRSNSWQRFSSWIPWGNKYDICNAKLSLGQGRCKIQHHVPKHTSNTFESFNPYDSDILWFLNVCPEEQCI